MLVWAEIDGGIAAAVTQLMNMPGVFTHASCQGGNGGGPCPEYRPYVMVTWKNDDARARIVEHFDLTEEGDRWAYAHPRFADNGAAIVADATDEYWSRDEENFSYESLGELLDSHDDLEIGDVVYVGRRIVPDPGDWTDAEEVLEQLACRAVDDCGEFADDYPEASKEAKAELNALLATWARKHCIPTFYMIKDVREYEITAEDLVEAGPTPDSASAEQSK
jgi:hypothetical protein